jgi:hypothetical protein
MSSPTRATGPVAAVSSDIKNKQLAQWVKEVADM